MVIDQNSRTGTPASALSAGPFTAWGEFFNVDLVDSDGKTFNFYVRAVRGGFPSRPRAPCRGR